MPIAQRGTQGAPASRTSSRPRLGVLATHPIQYQAPLYQELARRGAVDLDVAYLSHPGALPFRDPGFGVKLAWDIDLLSGYRSTELTRRPLAGKAAWLASASRWLRRQDVVVLHGHADPEMLLAAAGGWGGGPRRAVRHLVAGTMVRNAAGALTVGERNAAFYRRYGRIPQYA